MRGSIAKKGNRYYVILDRYVNGARKPKWIPAGASQEEADAKLIEINHEILIGEFIDPSTLTIEEYLKKWYGYAQPDLREKTQVDYEWAIKHINEHLGRVMISKLQPLDIEEMEKRLRKPEGTLGGTSANNLHGVFHIALRQAVKWKIIKTNPCDAVDAPKRDKFRPVVLDEEQLGLLLDEVAGTEMDLPVNEGLQCGMRRGEISGLWWEDVDLEKKQIHIWRALAMIRGKVKPNDVKTEDSERTIMLPEDLEQMLRCEARKQGYDVDDDVGDLIQEAEFLLGKQKKINRPTGYVWRRDDGLPYGPNYLYKHFKKIMTKLGLPAMRVHDLRHSFATFLLLKGVDIKIVAAILGHKREDFTRHTYEHILPAMQQQGTDAVNGLIKKAREKKER